jgi:hypothetical protein
MVGWGVAVTGRCQATRTPGRCRVVWKLGGCLEPGGIWEITRHTAGSPAILSKITDQKSSPPCDRTRACGYEKVSAERRGAPVAVVRVDHKFDRVVSSSWRGRTVLASLPDANSLGAYPGCRYAQPRAIGCDASGIGISDLAGGAGLAGLTAQAIKMTRSPARCRATWCSGGCWEGLEFSDLRAVWAARGRFNPKPNGQISLSLSLPQCPGFGYRSS